MTHHLQKSISIIFMFLMIISLIGCSSTDSSKKANTSHKVKTTEVKKDTKQQETPSQGVTAANQPNNPTTNVQATTPNPGTNQQKSAATTSSPAQVAQPSKPKTTTNAAASQQTTSSAPSAPSAPAAVQTPVQTVKISITGPKDRGTILNLTTVTIRENETILDVLLGATGDKIFVDHSGSGATAYVSGIDNYYERDPKYGAMSGWICKLNGTGIAKSAGAIKVNAGDRIEWIYNEN